MYPGGLSHSQHYAERNPWVNINALVFWPCLTKIEGVLCGPLRILWLCSRPPHAERAHCRGAR